MNWFTKFIDSSIGQKLTMSLSGIFLILFLIVHLLGNLQLLSDDGGVAFNKYSYFMTHNPIIKTISYLLYATILLHAFQGIRIWLGNKSAAGASRYAVSPKRSSEVTSRNMAWFGIVIFVFILIHMWQFWFQMKFGSLPMVTIPDMPEPVKDLYTPVAEAFRSPAYVLFYVVSMAVIGLHLWHGFWSSLQTLGLNHKKYEGFMKYIGYAYAFLVPVGFALIPILFYLRNA